MYSDYFKDKDIKPEFSKEFICIFDGWLGEDDLHKLDEVTDKQWSSFNLLVELIFEKYQLYMPDNENETCAAIKNIKSVIYTYKQMMGKDASQFTQLIIPELNCVLTEDWDYTYILWHKNNGAVDKLSPLIKQAGLYQFND